MEAEINVVSLTKRLVEMPSVSQQNNTAISDYLQTLLQSAGFVVERLSYTDKNQVEKVNLVAKLGDGHGGLAFCSHSDVVPGQEQDWQPWQPEVRDGLLYGRGSCDMKGALAATLVAVFEADNSRLSQPIYIVVTADEEIGLLGAKYVAEHSQILGASSPSYGIIAEPTEMIPVYAHKGMCEVRVTARGVAAHTSTGLGKSANFVIAPFLAEMAELADKCRHDPAFQNDEFNPPTNGFNMTITDFNCASNVTAPKAVSRISFRIMPNTPTDKDELVEMIVNKAQRAGLETVVRSQPPLLISPSAKVVHTACIATQINKPGTVSYGTDGIYLQEVIEELVVLGPGDIGVAHTVGEYVPVAELHKAVGVYKEMIERLCYVDSG